LYFKASIVSPPGDYSVSSTNLGSLAPGQSGFFIFTPVRAMPALTAGEYDETLTLRIDAYTDSGYSAAYANQTLGVMVHHFNHADASWTVIEHADFDDDTFQGWTASQCNRTNDDFMSSPVSVFIYPLTAGAGYLAKTINTGEKTKARIVFHIYDPTGDHAQVTVNGVVKKNGWVNTPLNTWARLAFDFPVNVGAEVVFTPLFREMYDYAYLYVDEIWVITK
jgi:hypothetical protein